MRHVTASCFEKPGVCHSAQRHHDDFLFDPSPKQIQITPNRASKEIWPSTNSDACPVISPARGEGRLGQELRRISHPPTRSEQQVQSTQRRLSCFRRARSMADQFLCGCMPSGISGECFAIMRRRCSMRLCGIHGQAQHCRRSALVAN